LRPEQRLEDVGESDGHGISKAYPMPQTVWINVGLGRVLLDLLAQPPDVHGDRGLVAERPAPNLFHQLLAV